VNVPLMMTDSNDALEQQLRQQQMLAQQASVHFRPMNISPSPSNDLLAASMQKLNGSLPKTMLDEGLLSILLLVQLLCVTFSSFNVYIW